MDVNFYFDSNNYTYMINPDGFTNVSGNTKLKDINALTERFFSNCKSIAFKTEAELNVYVLSDSFSESLKFNLIHFQNAEHSFTQ